MLRCAICGYDLRASINEDGARCAECGRVYSRHDLDALLEVPGSSGRPTTLSPREQRVSGWLLIVILVAMLGGVMWLLQIL